MKKTGLVNRIFLGIRRNWKKFPGWTLQVLGMLSILETIANFSSFVKSWTDKFPDQILYGTFIAAVLYVIYKAAEPRKITVNLHSINTQLNIYFGDIFLEKEKSHLVIPVNEFFDTQLGGAVGQSGDIVAPNSIHGQFITKIYNSDSVKLNSDLDMALKGVISNTIARNSGKTSQYLVGTTAVIGHGAYKCFLFALSRTDLITAKAQSDLPTMWSALEGVWMSVRNSSNNLPVSLPLVGGGLSHVGLDSMSLLRLIVMSITKSSQTKKITDQINIIIHENLMNEVVLRKIKEEFN